MRVISAEKRHARNLAYLINLAGEGIPEYLWRGSIQGKETALDVGEVRAARDQGSFSYSNARVCVVRHKVLGMIISYCQSSPNDLPDIDEYPDILRPLVQLEAKAPGSWYINAVATFEAERGCGVARLLIADAEAQAVDHGCGQISLIAASENLRARKLYQHIGFKVVDGLPVVPYPGSFYDGHWLLMSKSIH